MICRLRPCCSSVHPRDASPRISLLRPASSLALVGSRPAFRCNFSPAAYWASASLFSGASSVALRWRQPCLVLGVLSRPHLAQSCIALLGGFARGWQRQASAPGPLCQLLTCVGRARLLVGCSPFRSPVPSGFALVPHASCARRPLGSAP